MARRTTTLLIVGMLSVASGASRPAWADAVPRSVRLTAPVNGAALPASSNQVSVKLAWAVPPEPGPVRFFVEVVAIQKGALREVFASYVDQPGVTIRLEASPAEYAWRVYTVSSRDPEYAVSGWERFSIGMPKRT